MRLQVREAHFLEMIVVLALLNSLGKDRAYPRLLALLLHLLLRAIAMIIAHPTRRLRRLRKNRQEFYFCVRTPIRWLLFMTYWTAGYAFG